MTVQAQILILSDNPPSSSLEDYPQVVITAHPDLSPEQWHVLLDKLKAQLPRAGYVNIDTLVKN